MNNQELAKDKVRTFLSGKLGLLEFEFTGSVEYGPFYEASDVDVIVLASSDMIKTESFNVNWQFLSNTIIASRDNVRLNLSILGLQPDDGVYYLSLKVIVPIVNNTSRVVNLIFLGEEDYDLWKGATKLMQAIPPVQDKVKRYTTFEALKLAYRISKL